MAGRERVQKQLNVTIDEQLVLKFNAFCKNAGLIRDQKVQAALQLVLDTESRRPPKCVVVRLDERAGKMLQDMREEEFLGIAVESAITQFVERKGPRRTLPATRGGKRAGGR